MSMRELADAIMEYRISGWVVAALVLGSIVLARFLLS
jgi:hypothetical protein